jgi:hypothetical protein
MRRSYILWAVSGLLFITCFTIANSGSDFFSQLIYSIPFGIAAITFLQEGFNARKRSKRKLGAAQPYLEPLRRHQSSMQSASTSIARPETQPVGSVYLLKAGPFYKIGKSINFEKRLKQIKLQLPYPVEVVHTISTPEYSKLEAYWHQRFRSKRTNGEWFLLTDEDVKEFIDYLGPSQEGL